MTVAPSFVELYDAGKGEAQSLRPELKFYDGDVSTALMHGSAAMADHVILYGAQLTKKLFLDTAQGTDLDTLAIDRYQITRNPATAATVELTFARLSGGAGGTIPAGTVVKTNPDAAGVTVAFTTDTGIIVGTGDNGPFYVDATATILGPDGNVSEHTLESVTGALFDTFTVTNGDPAAGGNNQESDEALRQRCRDYSLTIRRGTAAAVRFGALQVPSVRYASTIVDGLGNVYVVVSDQDGNSNLQMVSDVEEELVNWACLGLAPTVIGATPYVVDLDLTVRHVQGFPIAAVSAQLIAAVEAKINAIAPGDTLTQHDVVAAIIAVYPAELSRVNFVSITGNGTALALNSDIAPATSYQKIKAGTITIGGE